MRPEDKRKGQAAKSKENLYSESLLARDVNCKSHKGQPPYIYTVRCKLAHSNFNKTITGNVTLGFVGLVECVYECVFMCTSRN